MTESFLKELDPGLCSLQLELSNEQKELLYGYYRMVIEKNKVMNLTAITEEADFVKKHIIDSLAIIKAGSDIKNKLSTQGLKLIDVGTGAGMPGIILKIAFPGADIILFDSLKKRLTFLDEVIEKLGLKSVRTLHGRAEDIGQDSKYREKFDIAVSRAVAQMNVLSEYVLPLVKSGGVFAAYKSGDYEDELNNAKKAVKLLGGGKTECADFELPGTDMKRSIILINKEKASPAKYPRKAGTPSREPII